MHRGNANYFISDLASWLLNFPMMIGMVLKFQIWWSTSSSFSNQWPTLHSEEEVILTKYRLNTHPEMFFLGGHMTLTSEKTFYRCIIFRNYKSVFIWIRSWCRENLFNQWQKWTFLAVSTLSHFVLKGNFISAVPQLDETSPTNLSNSSIQTVLCKCLGKTHPI